MVGWGGDMGLVNPPGLGPVKPGFARALTFALGGTATLHAAAFGHASPPIPGIRTAASSATINEGRVLYDIFCFSCHAIAAVASTLPDLRYATAETHNVLRLSCCRASDGRWECRRSVTCLPVNRRWTSWRTFYGVSLNHRYRHGDDCVAAAGALSSDAMSDQVARLNHSLEGRYHLERQLGGAG